MSENHKYYYLNIKEGFLDSAEMAAMERLPDGMAYSNILLKLRIWGLMHGGLIPYDIRLIAAVTRQPKNMVVYAMETFKRFGLITVRPFPCTDIVTNGR